MLESFLACPEFSSEAQSDRARMESLVGTMKNFLEANKQAAENFEVRLVEDPEEHVFLPVVVWHANGIQTEYAFKKEFFVSSEYKNMQMFGAQLRDLIQEGAKVVRDERQHNVRNFSQAMEWLLSEAKRGQDIQRYKGLEK